MNLPFSKRLPWLLLIGLAVVGLGIRPAWRSLRVSSQINAGRAAMLAGDQESAIELLSAAEQEVPDRADIQYWLGVASRRASQFDRAAVYLNRAQRAGWPREDIERQKLLQQAQTGNFTLAGEWMRSLPEDASEEVADEICEAFAQGCLASLKLREAQYWLESWCSIRPQAIGPRMLLARVFMRVDRHDQARKRYAEVLQIDPHHLEARQRLADDLLESSKLSEAIAEYERILKAYPSDPVATLGLAQAHLRSGRSEASREMLEAALATELSAEQRTKALADLASLDVVAGKMDRAIERLEEAAKLWPQEPSVQYKLGQCLRQAGRPEEAAKHLEQAKRLQDLKSKIGLLVKDIVAKPDDVEIRCELGDTALQLGLAREGVQWLSSALLMDPQCRRAHELLETHYREVGDEDRAQRHHRVMQGLEQRPGIAPQQSGAPPGDNRTSQAPANAAGNASGKD